MEKGRIIPDPASSASPLLLSAPVVHADVGGSPAGAAYRLPR